MPSVLVSVFAKWPAALIVLTSLLSQHVESRDVFRKPVLGENQIFFIKTSCGNLAGKDETTETSLELTNGMVCALESTARANPESSVFLFQPCPIAEDCVDKSRTLVRRLFDDHENVFLWQETPEELFAGTPIEPLLASGKISESVHSVVQFSDLMRYTLLMKYRGIYLDLDFITLKSFSTLDDNFLAIESPGLANNAAMGLRSEAGRKFARTALKMALESVNALYVRTALGPMLVTKVLKRFCPVDQVKECLADECHGVAVFNKTVFYAVHYSSVDKFFLEEDREAVLETVKDSHGVHLWHSVQNLTINFVDRSSKHAVAALQKEFCPLAYADSTLEEGAEAA